MVGAPIADEIVLALDADGTNAAATGKRVAVERRAAAADRWSFIPGTNVRERSVGKVCADNRIRLSPYRLYAVPADAVRRSQKDDVPT